MQADVDISRAVRGLRGIVEGAELSVTDRTLKSEFRIREIRHMALTILKKLFPKPYAPVTRSGEVNPGLREGWQAPESPRGVGFVVRHRLYRRPRVAAILRSLESGSAGFVVPPPSGKATPMAIKDRMARVGRGKNRRRRIAHWFLPGHSVLFTKSPINIPSRPGVHFLDETFNYIQGRILDRRNDFIKRSFQRMTKGIR